MQWYQIYCTMSLLYLSQLLFHSEMSSAWCVCHCWRLHKFAIRVRIDKHSFSQYAGDISSTKTLTIAFFSSFSDVGFVAATLRFRSNQQFSIGF